MKKYRNVYGNIYAQCQHTINGYKDLEEELKLDTFQYQFVFNFFERMG